MFGQNIKNIQGLRKLPDLERLVERRYFENRKSGFIGFYQTATEFLFGVRKVLLCLKPKIVPAFSYMGSIAT